MGIVFGITGTQEPPFTVLSKSPSKNYQIRQYSPYLIAEVPQIPGQDDNSFTILAKYIGVFGKPENHSKESLAMTSPVITVAPQKIPMTSPVINQKDTMSFVLPFNYTSVKQLPVPNDARIVLRAIPGRIIAVTAFSGWYTASEGEKHLTKLKAWLLSDNVIPPESAEKPESLKWSVAQYHPPFTIPFLRRNEIWVELDDTNETVRKMLEQKGVNS